MSGVRQRKAKTLQDDNSSAHQGLKYAHSECSKYSNSDKFVDRPYSLFWLCSVIAIFLAFFIIWDDSSDCWPCSNSSCSSFDVVSVRSHLINVTNMGSRTAGSIANEVAAADYLRNELKLIESVSNKTRLVVSLDEHRSGYSSFRALSHVSSYNNVRNFALRFHDLRAKGGNESKLAFLISCHYDTAPGSPGASGAFVNCSVMLEVCRILATGLFILFNDLIFLFNGAEESMLLSSHAFITQHKWATDIVAFMNLEGAGAAKRLFLSQSGPGPSSDVLLEAYANAFKQPLASVLGEDLFQFGLVPSDTDYRIFRDYGLVPGLDLAYIQDGYVYHTPYDTESRISNRCLRLSGCNILSFVQLIAKDERIQGFIKLTPINHAETLLRVSASGSPLGRNSVPPLVTRSATVRNVYFEPDDLCTSGGVDSLLLYWCKYLRHIPDSPEITEEESHILIVPIDANGIRYLTPNSYPMSALRLFMNSNEHNQSKFKGIKELVDAEPAGCNYSQPYCGVASVYPFLHIPRYFYRVPAEFHKIEPNVKLKLLSRTLLMNYLPNGRLSWNVTFSVVSGPPHTHILIRTDENYTKLTAWSFASTAMYPSSMPLPPPLISDIPSNKGEHYFLYHLNAAAFGEHGVLWETPWTFWVVFESQEVLSQSSYIDVAIAGLYVDEGVSTRSPPLSDFLSRLPPWVTVTRGCAVYDHWRFHLN
ncbi:Fxna peptidase (M28 family) [Schistosoma mansoni]|uniref:Fxna peptidase (M28 family) n=1 Tax=Schistosoma mansoni TaxID=6183 RepID=UPI00022DC4D1|nr:Fxna peptidase (M28 family) [Schistosoma mansoni]|eukprot:XP_018652143.1 Fxna peptidase (M28 family) [Schistosoma mansoni]